MSYVLVTINRDWADEFNVYGLAVYTSERWAEIVNTLHSLPDKYFSEVYFGTNEFLEWTNAVDCLSDFTVQEITDQEANVFKKFFTHYDNTVEFGHIFLDQIIIEYAIEAGDDNDC